MTEARVKQPPFELTRSNIYDTLSEALLAHATNRMEVAPEAWEYPVEDTLILIKDGKKVHMALDIVDSLIDNVEGGPLLAVEIERAVNQHLRSEGQGLQIETERVEDDDAGNFGYRTHRLIYRFSHTDYTGEETDDLLNI